MPTSTNTIEFILQGRESVSVAAQSASNSLQGLASTLSSLNRLFTFGLFGIGARQIADWTVETAEMGMEVERVRNSFYVWLGGDADEKLEALRRASRGLISDMDLMVGAVRAKMLQVTDDTNTLARLIEIAMIRGRAMGISTEYAFESIITGIGRMSPWILDNIGIVTGGQRAYEEYAKSIGKAADELTAVEKRMALINKVFEQTPQNVELLDDMAAKVERLSTAWENYRRAMGEALASRVAQDVPWLIEALNRESQSITTATEARRAYNESIREAESLLAQYQAQFASAPAYQRLLETELQAMRAREAFELRGVGIGADPRLAQNYRDAAQALREANETFKEYLATWRQAAGIEGLNAPFIMGRAGLGFPVPGGIAEAAPSGPLIEQFLGAPEDFENLSQAIQAYQRSLETPAQALERLREEQSKLSMSSAEYWKLQVQIEEAERKQAVQTEALAKKKEDLALAQMSAAEKVEYYRRKLEDTSLAEEERLDIQKSLLSVESQVRQEEERRTDTLFSIALATADLNTQIDLYRLKLAQTIPFSQEWLNIVLQIVQLQQRQKEQQQREAEQRAATAQREAESRRSELESIVSSVMRPTSVTEEQFALTRLGRYSDQWDEYVRRLRSAATDANSAWKDLIPQDIWAQGMDAVRVYAAQAERLFYSGRFEEIAGAPPGLRQQAIQGLVEAAKEEIRNRQAAEQLRREVIVELQRQGITGVSLGDVLGVVGTPGQDVGYKLGEGLGSGYKLWLQSGTWQSLSQETYETFQTGLLGQNAASEYTDEFGRQLAEEQANWENFGQKTVLWLASGIKSGVTDPAISAKLVDAILPKIMEALGGKP